MRVRFGYVALSMELKDASPNKTISATNAMKLDEETRVLKLKQLASQNLHNQLRLLKHNHYNDIMVYRMTSNLVPLATHDIAVGWPYTEELAAPFAEVGDYVKTHGFRVSFHPDHFVNLNSPRSEVLHQSMQILYHHRIQCQAMGLDETMKFNIHIGGAYGDKKAAIRRFEESWTLVPEDIRVHITLENDDKTYNAQETLALCQRLRVPMVFDAHHHRCHGGEDVQVEDILPDVFATWNGAGVPPLVHVSSPKGNSNANEFRSHADFVNVADVVPFLKIAANFTEQLDVMLEAKSKDLALFQLMRDLQGEPGIQVVSGAGIEL